MTLRPVVLDFETYFADDYTLKTMSTEAYVRDPRFEAHGAAVKWSPDTSAHWYDARQLKLILQEHDWSKTWLLCWHAQFDGLILSHHYGIKPAFWGCPMSMFRLLHPPHLSASLDNVRKHYAMPGKSTPYHLFKNKHWNEMSPDVQRQVAEGACDEVESIWQLFLKFGQTFPAEEYDVVDTVVRMFTDPVLGVDNDILVKLWESEEIRRRQAALNLGVDPADLQSADRFRELLEAEGIEIEYKQGKNKLIPCFAKTDDFMRDLLEHDDDYIRALTEARLGMKSTILQTRAETYAYTAQRGRVPVYLSYCGASTLRPTGGDSTNFLNMKRQSSIRRSLLAPEGYWLAPLDSSQIECIAENEIVLTDNGPKAIQHVLLTDRVWDGIEWVAHEGVVCKGEKSVISYQGLTATPEHIVYVRGTRGEEKMEMRLAASLARDLVVANAPTAICQTSMRKRFMRRIQNLRCPRNKIQIQIGTRSSYLGGREFTASKLYWSRNRSQKQRRSLRTRQFAIVYASSQRQQSLYYFLGSVAGRLSLSNARFQTHLSRMQIWSRSNKISSGAWIAGRRNNLSFATQIQKNDISQTAQKRLQTSSGAKTKTTKVYDIVNAGPRHRFTVSGVLVSNCRVLHYLAGGSDEPVVQKFRRGEDPYVELPTKFYGRPVYKPKKGDPEFDLMEQLRGVGKQGRLMCGYGAAGKQFKTTAKNGLYGPPVEISIEDANAIVALYRSENPSVCAKNTGYWAQAERMIARLAGGPPCDWGPLHVKDGKIYLPNGTMMHYDSLEYHRPDENEECRDFERGGYWRLKTKRGWKKLWGSKLTQNICEAVSRVVVSQAHIRIKKMGIRTLNWPYDELLLLIPKGPDAERVLEACKSEMTREVSWLPGLPLDCEGELSDRYSK